MIYSMEKHSLHWNSQEKSTISQIAALTTMEQTKEVVKIVKLQAYREKNLAFNLGVWGLGPLDFEIRLNWGVIPDINHDCSIEYLDLLEQDISQNVRGHCLVSRVWEPLPPWLYHLHAINYYKPELASTKDICGLQFKPCMGLKEICSFFGPYWYTFSPSKTYLGITW